MKENTVPFHTEDIGTRINEISTIVGGKKKLSKLIGISEAQLHRIVSGESQPRLEPIIAMAKEANVSLSWLATGEGPMQLSGSASAASSDIEELNEFALVPGYSIQVSAGDGAFPADEQPSRRLAFRKKWLKYRGLCEKDLVLVFAKGDSMEPTISDNNTLMIDTSQKDLSDGSIYVIRTDHHLIVKRVQALLNQSIMFLSDNKAYQPISVKLDEAKDLEVIGRVVWIGKDI